MYSIEVSPFIPVHEKSELENAPIVGKLYGTFEEAQTAQLDWCYDSGVATSKFRITETE